MRALEACRVGATPVLPIFNARCSSMAEPRNVDPVIQVQLPTACPSFPNASRSSVVEQPSPNRQVVGSNPTRRAIQPSGVTVSTSDFDSAGSCAIRERASFPFQSPYSALLPPRDSGHLRQPKASPERFRGHATRTTFPRGHKWLRSAIDPRPTHRGWIDLLASPLAPVLRWTS